MSTMTNTAATVKLNKFLDTTGIPANYGDFETTIPGPFASLHQMERENIRSGSHYFDADAKRFFRSRIYPQAYYGRFFIDSIQFEFQGQRHARQYKIRCVLDDGSTSSVIARDSSGNWREDFPTLDSAKRALHRLVKRGN